MARKKAKRVSDADLTGLKYLKRISSLLKRLRPVGCERDKAGNRDLFFDQYCGLILLYMFNPIVTSLRGMQQTSQLKKVQRLLGCQRASLGSLSEAARVFDPELLREIAGELLQRAPQRADCDPRLKDFAQTLTAVDGSLLKKLPQITQACFATRNDRGFKLHAHFEILKGVPVKSAVTDASGQGPANEKNVLRSQLEPDRCYVIDRGYEQFSLFNAIVDVGSSYVCRIRNDRAFTADEVRELDEEARAAGVLEDAIGQLGSPKSRRIEHPQHRVRRVVIRAETHPKRGGRKRAAATHDVVLVTNLLDVPAEIIALIYRSRWMIELYFRFLKHVLGCRKLLSDCDNGIEIQTYCAIIACLLISLVTGRKPTLRTYEMLCYYFQGLADEEELLAHINRLPPHATTSV
ncbi:Transposase DDE domain protein [Symmachiella dynata]|uniref:Transposase DDE domain protein n=1 Tax=Symmachiella dynata TaxID=2527995 RepID=A0A517ZMQ8_9PLAN|nr:IS4 family transposase [Symmachiella dynata]QDU43313.1 Transposase DDE domain protein [Symmachiella dynata]QDU43362.1 Transposase DDE domain protein [Symmachiella dynata]QDU43715.1 Transposase DDE domain protein [Symmachiella dynata]QDU44078.1 Transposase DDE domain protein [Symmachiella dynata]QDU47664.1 Transposase DDE domain protein [Symmachiella dynata]